jgi:hypothetical protein
MIKWLYIFGILILAVYLDHEVDMLRKIESDFNPFILSVLPSFIASFFLPLAYCIFKGGKQNVLKEAPQVIMGLFIYEISQIFIFEATFDYYDLISTLLGGLFFTIVFYNCFLYI